jgi:hypothetical protein
MAAVRASRQLISFRLCERTQRLSIRRRGRPEAATRVREIGASGARMLKIRRREMQPREAKKAFVTRGIGSMRMRHRDYRDG